MIVFGSGETLLLLFLLLAIVFTVAVWWAAGRASRAETADLPILREAADRSAPHPTCPNCGSVSFHPAPTKSHSIFLLVIPPIAFGTASRRPSNNVIACTVCGRRYRQG